MHSLAAFVNLILIGLFGAVEVYSPSLFSETYGVKLDTSKPGSVESLAAFWLRTAGVNALGYAGVLLYAVTYKIHKFTQALLRVASVLWAAHAYNLYQMMPWMEANKVPAQTVTFQVWFNVGVAVFSLLGSFFVPSDNAPAGNKKRA